jgi:SAM-dependent methyltransferase
MSVTCNICDWTGISFAPMGARENAVCPSCGSLERHRALALWLGNEWLTGQSVLDIGPIEIFREHMEHRGAIYTSIGLEPPAMIQRDLLDSGLPDSVYDIVICYHVLEHIRDDIGALMEIRRVLKAAGLAIIQVPYDVGREQTIEHDVPDKKNHGHVRGHYGADFGDRLREAGLPMTSVLDLAGGMPVDKRELHGVLNSGLTWLCVKASADCAEVGDDRHRYWLANGG